MPPDDHGHHLHAALEAYALAAGPIPEGAPVVVSNTAEFLEAYERPLREQVERAQVKFEHAITSVLEWMDEVGRKQIIARERMLYHRENITWRCGREG